MAPALVLLVAMAATVTRAPFGKMPDGATVDIYTLTNIHGMEARIMTYGAVVVSLKTPDRSGRLDDVVLGFDNFEDYLTRSRFFGAVAGRYANRIGNARFSLDGTTYELAANNGKNHLHGGRRGFDKVVWSYPGALFMSAGGYHHHLGTNTWARGAPPATDADARLLEWEIVVPTAGDADKAGRSVEEAGYPVKREGGEWVLTDPWGTGLRLVPEHQPESR